MAWSTGSVSTTTCYHSINIIVVCRKSEKQIKANNLWLRRSFILSENQRSEWVEFVGSLFREVFPRVLRFSALAKNEHYRISADYTP